MAYQYVGRPWHEVEPVLRAAGTNYTAEIARPARDFFKIDEKYLYILRERKDPEGSLQFVLAARCTGVLPVQRLLALPCERERGCPWNGLQDWQ